MKEEALEVMVINHDKHLDRLTTSVESLAESVGSTNAKLDNVIEVISAQNVMVERMNNLDVNIKEFANDIRGKLRDLDETQSGPGCAALKVTDMTIGTLGDRLKVVETQQKTFISATALRWAGGILLSALLLFVTYANDEHTEMADTVHKIDKLVATKIEHHAGITSELDLRISNLEGIAHEPTY